MPSLSKELRRLLEKTIAGENGARQIAELGAEQSLRRLAVDRHEPHASLTPEERTLRTQLRAHGRQLGDKRDLQRGSQSTNHLTQAVAYEHWHRLLFARFLAENNLLMHPEHGVALSLDEVKEVALGVRRDWIDIASEYAQRMLLREVFRPDDPALKVTLSPERRLELEGKLNSLPREIFLADDSLGWVYQYWQKDAKEQVNKSEVKIGADELSPVTQLFTEDYMVLFLLENTLGAWWAAKHGQPELPGYQWTYLGLNKDGIPSAGCFKGWPQIVRDLRILDPCMGSGHFLTFALPILAHMRAEEEGLSLQDAVAAVLRDNIFGLELDLRCSQIAAFNLALTAWKLIGHHFDLPSLNLACSGLGINAKEDDWVKLAGEDGLAAEGMRRLYSLFRDAPVLGSLIDPLRLKANVFSASTERVLPLLEAALTSEGSNEEARELAIAAQGVLAAFRILSSQFTLVITNVPYLGRGKQTSLLAQYCDEFHSEARADLATCFVDRSLRFCSPGGSVALVTPQNWTFQGTYAHFRKTLLTEGTWNGIARLGVKAFNTPMWDFNVMEFVMTRGRPSDTNQMACWDVSAFETPSEKATHLLDGSTDQNQRDLLLDQKHVISFGRDVAQTQLSDYASAFVGLQNGDSPRFIQAFWEQDKYDPIWEFFQLSHNATTPYSGRDGILKWEGGIGELSRFEGLYIKGREAWGKDGVAIRHMGTLPATLYSGNLYDQNIAVIVPNKPEDLDAIWAFCSSDEYHDAVRRVDQALKVTNSTLVKVPFDITRWRSASAIDAPCAPSSVDPTQWLFDGKPASSANPLQTAVARLLGFRWPRQSGVSFRNCPAMGLDETESYIAADGLVCLSSVAGEELASTRLRELLKVSFGDGYNVLELLDGKKSKTLEEWLRNEFFEEHCQVFQNRPFIWHIWDGLSEGFHAFVNYHRLDHRNLEKLIYSYLGDWLTRQRQDLLNGVEGADSRLAAAEHLQKELIKILDGEAPYDIFARWKPLQEQALGWTPDLNDGVRINIRPWITEAKLYKSAKPGILRATPNIKYTKDRGKEPSRDPNLYPWFDVSTDRINDHHLTLAGKRSARGLK